MVSRRQLIKISALGTASFAAPTAYSVSEMTMSYNTRNPIGSTDPRDLSDNAKCLDSFANGPEPIYTDRLGANRKSIPGMIAEFDTCQLQRGEAFHSAQTNRESAFDAAQLARDTEFSDDQDNREAQFNSFIDASGYEPSIAYASGILLDRTTKTVAYLGNEYRAKSSFIPMTTTSWATDEAKLKLIGDDSLRQNLAGLPGSAMVGHARARLATAVTNAGQLLSVQAVSVWEFAHLITVKPVALNPDTWDWYPAVKAALEYSAAWGVEVDGYNQLCYIGTKITITTGQVRLKNATIKALPSVTGTMLKLNGATANPQFNQVVFDGNYSAYSWVEVENTHDAAFTGCTFKTLGNNQPNVFGLWVKGSKRVMVLGCRFSDLTSLDVTRAIYFMGDCRGAIMSANTFSNITSLGDDADAIVCEEFSSDNQAFVVDGNYFENVQKRLVKAGGNGWVITNNRAKTTLSGGLYSIFSLYGSDIVLTGNNIEVTSANVDYPIDLGGIPGSMASARNITIAHNIFRLKPVVSPGVQDLIRQSNVIENLRVHDNYVDHCRAFYNNPLSFTLNNAHFFNNTSEFCYGNDFNLGVDATGSDVLIFGHTSLKSVTGFGLIYGGGLLTGVSASSNSYKKSSGLSSSDIRFIEANGNINNGVVDANGEYRNGARWYHRASAPGSGQHRVGDITWRTPVVAGQNGGWLCVADGAPGTWVPFAPTQTTNAYSVTGGTDNRALAISGATVDSVASVLGTLIRDLRTSGLLK